MHDPKHTLAADPATCLLMFAGGAILTALSAYLHSPFFAAAVAICVTALAVINSRLVTVREHRRTAARPVSDPSDDRAVSPVIAVILMVAITVVLAATVYVWVSGFGAQGNITKFPQVNARDASEALTAGTTDALIRLEHRGGDTVNLQDYRIEALTEDGDAFAISYAETAADCPTASSTAAGAFGVGDTLILCEDGEDWTDGDVLTVRFIDVEQNSIVYDHDITPL